MAIYFITGIDTNIGKSYATGMVARSLIAKGRSVITAKLAQTGCKGVAEDIVLHRKIMGIDLLAEDIAGETCPYVFELPASPHLAARCEDKEIEPQVIVDAVNELDEKYDIVLVEGAGGVLVPLNDEVLSIDIATSENWPVIIVSSPRLGSINHTLLTIEASENRGGDIAGVIYNMHGESESVIAKETKNIIENRVGDVKVLEIGSINDMDNLPETDLWRLV